MNAIFKVLWNKARGQFVATDETKTAFGKGKVRSTVQKGLSALLLSALAAGSVSAAGVVSGWDSTTVTADQAGKVLNVTTSKYVNDGKTGINKFSQFTVNADQIANLQFGSGQQLLNLVNAKIEIDGVVNAVKNNKIGGDLYFVSPVGMVVGTTGVINAGSLTTTITTQDQFNTWSNLANGDQPTTFNDAFLQNLRTGDGVPINPAGVITVKGSINAGNSLALLAGSVQITSGASLTTGVANFQDLVNIRGADGQVTTSANLEKDLAFETDPDTGDVLLFARAAGDLAADAETQAPESGEKTDGKGTAVAASVVVEEGAVVKAAGNLTAKAYAGNGAVNPLAGAPILFKSSDGEGRDVSASVELLGTVHAEGNLTAEARAFNIVDHSTSFIGKALETIQSGFVPIDTGTIEYVDMSADARVTVGEKAEVTGVQGLTLESEAHSDLKVGNQSGFKNFLNWGKAESIPVVSAAAMRVKNTSAVEIKGALATDGELKLAAAGDLKVDASVKAATSATKAPQASFIYADLDAGTNVSVADGASIGAAGTSALGPSKVTVEAKQTNRVETDAETNTPPTGNIALAVNITKFNASAQTNIGAGFTTSGTADVRATNKTETLKVRAKTTVGDYGIQMKIMDFGSNLAFGKVADSLAGVFGTSAGGSATTSKFQLGGAAAYVKNAQSATVTIEPNVKLESTGKFTVEAKSDLADHHYEAVTKQVIDNEQGNAEKDKQGALAILINETGDGASSLASVTVGDGASITTRSSGDLTLSSEALINKDRFKFLKQELIDCFNAYADHFTADAYKDELAAFTAAKYKMVEAFDAVGQAENFTTGITQLQTAFEEFSRTLKDLMSLVGEGAGTASDFIDFGMSVLDFLNPASYTNAFVSAGGKTYKAQADNPFSVAGSLAVLDQTTKSAVEVGAGAALESAEALGLTATSRNESIAMGGQLDNFLGVPLPNIDKGKSLGASVVYHELGTDNLILVKEGAALSGTKTDLNANDELDGVTIAASAGYNTGTLSASGMAAVTEADAKNRIAIDDEARIEARSDDLTIKALRDDSVQTVAGALSFVKSVDGAANAVGAGVAVNLGSFGNTLEMKDLDGTSSIGDYGAGALKAGGTLALTAESGLSLNAVGLAGQAGVSGSGSANTKKPDAAGDLGALGTQTGSSALTGAASGLAEGGALQGAVSSGAGLAAAQAGGDAAGADGSYSGLETGNPSSALSGIASAGSVTSGIEAAGSSFQLSAAGSFAWNDVTESNVLHIEGASADQNGMITLDAQKTAVESVTNKWVGAFAGGAAVSVSKGGSGTSVGIGGAAAVNQNNAENRLTIKNVSLSEKVENMGVYSLVNGTTVAQGLGVAVSTSGGPAGAIDAGVSVNLIENTVRADVEGLSVGNESGEFEYAQTAWTGEIQVTGGTTVGVASGSGGFSGAVGAAVAVADIDNTVASTLKGANFTNAKSVDVKALASLTQVNTAVGVQAAVGSGSGAALNGSIISADITNIVNASAEDSQASLAKDGSFTITARDAGTGDGEEAHAYAERAKGRTGFVEEDELLNRSLLKGVQIAEDDSGENYRDLSSGFMDGSGMTQVSAAISVAATGGSSGGAGGAGVVVTDFENTFGASSKGLTVTHDGSGLFSEKAQSDVVTVAVAAGAAGTSGNFSASGSVIVSDVTQTAQASAEDLTLTAGAMKDDAVRAVLAAQTNAKTVNVAGNVSVQVSAGGGGLGAAVVVAEVENNALTTLKNSTISSVKDASAEDGSTVPGALGLLAENNSEIWTAAAAATVSSNAALGASVAVNRAVGNAQIDVDAVTLDGLGHFDAQARDDSELWTLSGAVSAAVKPGAAAGAGLAFASSRGSTKADVNGLTLLASEEKTDIGVSAEAQDHVSTLTLAVGAGGSVGLSGAAAKNVVERTVAADLTGLKTNNKANEADETIEGAGDVVVRAESRADIDNLALVAAGSQAAALGAGVAVNTIDVDVAAGAHDLKAGVSSLNVAAHSANDIDTIGVGGAGAGTIAAAGSTAFNTITGDTSAALTDSILQAADAVAVHAESDDVIGTYAGQGVGAGTIALGLSVAMSERSGATTATVSGSSVKETGTGTGTLTMKSGVADANINNAIVEQDALNIQTSLEDKRAEETVDGIAVSATSATTYKTLTINGGGGGSAQAAGTASIVTHAGKTEAGVSQSTLESAGKLAVEAGDYANFSSVLVTAGGAGGISANGSVTQTDAAHATRAAVENSSLTSAAATTLSAEAKEGVSNLTIAAGGAGAIAVDAVVAIANQKSSVVTALENSTVAGGAYTQKADYLGRITNLGVSAAGAGALAGAATVAINTADVVVKSVVDGGSAVKPAGAVSIEAGRTLDWNEYGGAAAASGAGAVAGTVYINETAGETLVVVDDAQLGDGTNQVTLSAKNDDSIELVAVSAAGAKYVAAGATVAVNTMAGNVGTMVKNAALKGTDVKVEALADRKAKSTLVSASASLAAGLAANVFSTRVGGTGSYAELLGEGDAGTSATLEKFKGDYGALSKKELTTGAAGGASEGEVKAETEAKSDLVKGTGVMSVNSTFEGSNSVTLAAKEDAKAGSGIDAELGLGTAGAFNALGATVESSVKNANTVSVESGAVLRTQSTEGVVALAATGEDQLEHEALTRIEGSALANANSNAKVTVERTNTVSLKSGAEIRSGGEVLLNAGAAADGTQSKLEMQNRAESFSYAFLSGISADLNAKTKLSGIVDVAGKVVSTTNTAVTGDSGDYMITGDSLSHYWGQLKADDKSTLAVKGSGKKDAAVEETGRINVTGSIDAGVNTKADIVISGLLNPEGSDAEIAGSQNKPTVKVEAGTEEAKESILSSISGPVSESEGNVYWERYAELEKILREYTGATTEAIVGYQAEFEALAALMEQKGLGEWVTLEFTEDGKTVTQRTFVPIEKSEELYVAVNGITVSGGSIKLNAAEVTGSGAISANAAEGVWIKNESNASLKVGDIVIQAKGGEIELNGVAADESALKEAGFQGNVRSSDNTADPVISIESEAQTGSYTVKYKEDEPGNPLTVTPSTNLVLTGEIRNNAGDVSIWAKDGDLVSLGDVGASGTLTLTAKGSIMQSYTSGLTNIGGDVPGNAWQNEIGQISSKDNYDSSKDPSTTSVSSNAQAPSGGKWVAGGAIIISGDLINLNGTVQSGYDTYELKINETVLEAKISEIREAWRRAGSPTNIDVKSSAYQLQAEKAVETNDGSYKLLVAAWYDPVKDRIVMDDVLPEGGSIFITGKIASTGGGKIFASDGSADVRFNAGNHDVLTGRIDTGSSKGVVQFTDLFWSDSKKDGTGAKVTRWQDGKTTEYMVDHNGQAIGEKTVRNGIQNYSPKDGLLYVWTEGTVSGSTETQYYEYMAKWWGGADDKLKDAFETEKTTVTKSGDLYQGATITDQLTRPNKGGDQDANFYAWMDVLAQTDTGYQVTKKKWKTGFLGCHKWTSYTITRDTTSKRMVTYTVKADKDVSVGFLKGSNTVDITSNRSIHLGNSITAQGGTISLNAGGDIRAESAGASLNGADTINLTAKGDIGSSLRPIALKGGSGELKLGAEAANIHIDGTNLGAGRSVSSDGLLAGSTLSVAVRGDLQAAKAQGKDVTLSSVEGGVKVNDLRQLEAAGTHAVNISALNDVEVTASTGDLGLGLIESKSGDVVLTVENGSVYDASGAADASDVSDEKRLEAWKRAGLINADGSSTGDKLWEADVEAEKNRITQAYARMESYKAFKEKGGELTDAQEQDYTDLQAIYGEFASAEAAVSAMEQDENSSLGKLVASRENYGWTENDLLYSIADTIINSEGSSTTTARATNVRGKNVEINAANAGSVGEVGETVTGRLSDEDETKRLALLKALSRADIGDFSSKDGVVSVTLKIPVTIEASGNLTVNARDNIFLESPEDSGLAVKEIVSKTGDVRVTSRGGISAAEGSGLVSGNTVTLRGGTGGIGAADAYLKIHSDPAKWAAVNAGGDIFIEAVDANGALGDMTLYSLAGDQDVSLKANNLYAYSGDKLGDDYDDFAELGYIQGQTLNFEVRGDFGTEDTALRVGTSSTVNFSESVGNVRLRGMGESGELAINGINASGVVDIDSEGGLKVGAVKGDSVELDALKQITLTGNLESTGEHKDLAVTSKEAGIELADNSTVRSKGGVKLDAKAGELKFTGGVVEAAGDASLLGKSVTATQGNLSAGGRIEIGATGGGIDAAGLQTQAGAGTLITAVGGGVALSGGSSIEAAGDVKISSEETLDLANATVKSTAGKVELDGLAGIVAKEATLLAAKEVTVTAKENVEVSNSTVEAASLAITAAKNLTGTELKGKITGAAELTAGENLVLDSADLSGGTVNAVAAQGLSAHGAALNATEGTLTLTAEADDIDASSAKLTAKDELTLTAQQSITAADASVEAASLAMTANTGSVEASRLTATVADQASVEAGDAVVLNNADLTAGALTATATSGDLSVKAAEINATKGGVTLTAKAVDIDASGVNLTAVGPAKLTAGQNLKLTPSGDAVASVTAKSLSATAGGALDASRLQVKVNEASAFRSNGLLTLTDANVSGGSLRAEGDAGVEGSRITVDVTGNGYNEGDRGDYEGVVTIKSSKGPITLTGADVKANKGDFFARSEGDLNVETAGFKIQDGGLGFKSTGGNLTLAGATGLKGDFLEMEAHGSIGMEDMELSVEEILRISAGGDINSRNLQLEITEDENGVGGKAYFEATTGTVHLEGSTITAKTSDGFIGDMTVIAGKDARLDDVFTPEKNVKAESMSIRAGDAVNFGEGTVALETKKDLTVEANHLTGDRIAAESVFAAGSALSISVKEDLHVEEGVQVSGKNVKFSSKDFTLADRTTVRGGSTAEIDASGEVAFTGDVLVTADDSVGIGAASGGITFTGAVTVGDETKSENKAKVTLHAAGSILQREVSGNAGVRGSSLEAQSSGGFVKLDAREGGTSGEGGNAFTKAEIESAGDVVFGSTGRTTELAVNASKNGAVSGDLRVQGERGAVIFTNGVSASGEVAVNAAAVQGSDLSADGRLAIVTALEKNAPKGAPQGVVFSGGLSGSIVTVYAGSGDVVIEGPVRSTLGEVDVYRLDQTERGVVRVGEADSAHTLVVFNARGDVVAGPMHSADTLYAFAGWEGRVYGRSGFTSDVHKAGAVEHAEPIGLVPDLSEWLNLDAAELDPSALPRLSFTARNLEYADTDRIGPWRFLLEDLTTPLGSWLFLRLRPDAAEDDQADEALLEGFPARKDGVIRDLRESTKEDFGWIMTSL